ncbi:hypothetical protein [Hyphomicrobium sp. ghe19]|uniref:hypothetical protein n=1 Tax=Hyphomicrobium sp. ghe19 TaxID=2682968 RepID=UPI0013679686|nr:hypothetical protein HYPP_03788 [Hyphomicrobium sp. ghe19]
MAKSEEILSKPAHKMTTEELLSSLLRTFQVSIDPGSPKYARVAASTANKQITTELALRIDRD